MMVASTTAKIVVVAAIAMAKVQIATIVKPGFLRSARSE
jgi:hypothetical protein